MARSDLERYDDTYDFLMRMNPEVAQAVDQMVSQNAMSKGALGQALSLKGIWSKGHLYKGQHQAMRALMLCQALFLTPPWARKEEFTRISDGKGGFDSVGGSYQDFNLVWQTDVATSNVRNMSEKEIKELISCYYARPNATADDLAVAAEGAVEETRNGPDYRTYTRNGPTPFGGMCVCYDGVRAWLYKAGFVSMRWMTHEGPSLIARTSNQMLGDGEVISEDRLDRMPRGWIFNFHKGDSDRRNNKDVCHWGISLGQGIGAATNTTDEEEGKKVNFIRGAGPAKYGVFRLRESYDVCKLKYGGTAVIRQIDPHTVPNLY